MAIDGEEFDDDELGGAPGGGALPPGNYDPALTENLSGTQKAAILLIALGPEKSSAIFSKYLLYVVIKSSSINICKLGLIKSKYCF